VLPFLGKLFEWMNLPQCTWLFIVMSKHFLAGSLTIHGIVTRSSSHQMDRPATRHPTTQRGIYGGVLLAVSLCWNDVTWWWWWW